MTNYLVSIQLGGFGQKCSPFSWAWTIFICTYNGQFEKHLACGFGEHRQSIPLSAEGFVYCSLLSHENRYCNNRIMKFHPNGTLAKEWKKNSKGKSCFLNGISSIPLLCRLYLLKIKPHDHGIDSNLHPLYYSEHQLFDYFCANFMHACA